MSKKKLVIFLMAMGMVIVIGTLIAGFIGFPKKGFGYLKILMEIFGLFTIIVGTIFSFIKEDGLRKLWEIIRPHNQQEFILISLGLLIGLLFSIFIPYGAGFDEETHTIRTLDICNLILFQTKGKLNSTAAI